MALSSDAVGSFVESLYNNATDPQMRVALRALNAAVKQDGFEGTFAGLDQKVKGLSEETLVEALYLTYQLGGGK